ELAKLVPAEQLTVFAAALVRAALDKSVVQDVKDRTDAPVSGSGFTRRFGESVCAPAIRY
ncbi:hypothetical protein PUR28_00205, partial [Streptomyces sp. BE308]|nr:hypothetical protein [Streptomyces sp. BE308]